MSKVRYTGGPPNGSGYAVPRPNRVHLARCRGAPVNENSRVALAAGATLAANPTYTTVVRAATSANAVTVAPVARSVPCNAETSVAKLGVCCGDNGHTGAPPPNGPTKCTKTVLTNSVLAPALEVDAPKAARSGVVARGLHSVLTRRAGAVARTPN